ncbi:hypothetical protein FRC06_001010 [Ceratobasidium sp. 370]|nr:hypothetical protein FRC06_001010 [Ceratobasidium sp. 370]
MVHLLGVHLADHKALKASDLDLIALTAFYGIGRQTSLRLMARLQIHETAKVGSLTPQQITQLTAFLSSPSTAPPPVMTPLALPSFVPPTTTPPFQYRAVTAENGRTDRLANIKLENELMREETRDGIACSGTKHANKCANSEEAEQNRAEKMKGMSSANYRHWQEN